MNISVPQGRLQCDLELPWRHVWNRDGFVGADGEVWEVESVIWVEDRLYGSARRVGADTTHAGEVSPDASIRVVWVDADSEAERAAIFELQRGFQVSPIREA